MSIHQRVFGTSHYTLDVKRESSVFYDLKGSTTLRCVIGEIGLNLSCLLFLRI